jgi:hypothetical protein
VKIAAAALLYFLAVFGAGFALGPIRVLWLEPRLGVVAATLCEAPFLLLAMIAAGPARHRSAARDPACARPVRGTKRTDRAVPIPRPAD